MSTESVEAIDNNGREAWDQLCRELEDMGISASLANTHKAFIIRWMKDAVDAGLMIEGEGLELATNTTSSDEQTGFSSSSLGAKQQHRNKELTKESIQSKLTLATRTILVLLRPFRSPTAIHKATRDGDSRRMELIFSRGCNVNFKDDYNLVPLHWAIMRGHVDASRLLLKWGADPEAKDSDGRTALGVASWQGIEDIVKILLEHNADIASRDNHGLSPLHGTARNRCPKVCGILLSHGASVKQTDSRGWTALHWAAYQGYDEMLDILTDAGSELRAKSNGGETPLALAVRQGHEKTVSKLQELLAAQEQP